jgi:2-polyprenyl-6-methoxyphenol hydroxylase-like FAD-dependent oxidoreductase
MQFHHAHGFRAQAVQAVRTEMPDAYERLLALGAEPVSLQLPDGREVPMGMRCRRPTFEIALRASALATPGLTLHRGHVDAVMNDGGRATGLQVDGTPLAADLVIDASGRAGRVTRSLRAPPTAGGTCGIAYVDRQYQLHPGAEPGPLVNPIAWQADCDGYAVIIFIHELGTFSVLIIRPTGDRDLVGLRHEAAFSAACRVIPGLSDWTDPERSRPITRVLPGGALMNYYRSQTGPDGRLALPGLLFVGDAVCTTTPNFGRGITTSLLQATEALRLIDEHGDDHVALGEAFDEWCEANMLPWVEDHAHMDESIRRRWSGEDIDLTTRLPSDLIMTAAEVDPAISPAVMPYMTMTALPSCLDPVEPLARAVYATGWRPATSPGPSRPELAGLIGSTIGHAP